jgi:hypothetical protein
MSGRILLTRTARNLKEAANGVDGCPAEEQSDQYAGRPDDQAGDPQQQILEQDTETDQHHAQRRQRVETGEGGCQERGDDEHKGHRPEDDAAEPMREQKPKSRM